MRLQSFFCFIVIGIPYLGYSQGKTAVFDMVTPHVRVSIFYDKSECTLDSIAAHLLAGDIESVTGYLPPVYTDLSLAKDNIIVIGTCRSKLVRSIGPAADSAGLAGKWECYSIKLLRSPIKKVNKALLITGSDFRGTAYGVFSISEKIGVTPWYWWADATPAKKAALSLTITDTLSLPPSVKYRGIFINDEDWGLQPWAAKTFEPGTGDIGPKTYARVFQLLLRLKANLIWPAMHPCTKPFYHYAGNIRTAQDYQIIVGSSHAEPMLRNNVGEWNERSMGPFNYLTNRQKVYDYWRSRVEESSRIGKVIYTTGMRGVHDGAIEGVKTPAETVPLLERIIADQRELLRTYVNKDVTKVPQVFTPYKEVLESYDAGLKVPEDVTLVWPDDNYGYIQRLSDEKENARPGGSGVYYHISYWGRPHDYLWLSSTHPALIREEMTRAYRLNDRTLWVVNVGDIKPAEYDLQLFLDMAYHIQPFLNSAYSRQHLETWVSRNLGSRPAKAISGILWKYYQLAFERRPEFMGWSQTEPTTPVQRTAYNHTCYGDQGQRRIDAYDSLERRVKALRPAIARDKAAFFYETVYYPVVCASLMNKKFLFRDKAFLYAGQGRVSARYFDSLSTAAYREIAAQTAYYDSGLAGGKWAGIMSMHPRNLPVFQAPEGHFQPAAVQEPWRALPEEAADSLSSGGQQQALPVFDAPGERHFIDLFLCKDVAVSLAVRATQPWIKVSAERISLRPVGGQSQTRVWVDIDRAKLPAGMTARASVVIQGAHRSQEFTVHALGGDPAAGQNFEGFIGKNGVLSLYAGDYQSRTNAGDEHWERIAGLGATGAAIEALPFTLEPHEAGDLSAEAIRKHAAVCYTYRTRYPGVVTINLVALPTFPLNRHFELRCGVSLDDGPVTVLNFRTFGRSEEWKQAVLSNSLSRGIKGLPVGKGEHHLKVYLIDPGLILDRIIIAPGGLRAFYGLLPETRNIRR